MRLNKGARIKIEDKFVTVSRANVSGDNVIVFGEYEDGTKTESIIFRKFQFVDLFPKFSPYKR